MVQIKKKKEIEAKIPDAGMSDIVFLLLLFFLVSTTIDVDTGIGLGLPEYQEEQEVVPISKERLVTVNINENGDVLLNKEVIAIPQISENLKERIESKINFPLKKKLIVSIKTDRKTNYNLYIQALDQIVLAYSEVQEAYSQQVYGKALADLTPEEKKVVVKEKIPKIISIAEPEKINYGLGTAMNFKKKRSNSKQEIPTSSMPDIIFMLLLFFMVATTLREVDVYVKFRLPEAEAIEKIENKRLISYIWVGKSGKIQLNDNIVALDEIQDIMYKKRVELPNVIVSLRIDKESNMGVVTDIQQTLRKASTLRINYSSMLKQQ